MPKTYHKYPIRKRREAVRLYDAGERIFQIADRLKVPSSIVSYWIQPDARKAFESNGVKKSTPSKSKSRAKSRVGATRSLTSIPEIPTHTPTPQTARPPRRFCPYCGERQ